MKSIAVIGDSHADGLQRALPSALNAAGFTVVHYEPHGGWSSKALLDRGAVDNAIASRPDVVLVVAGHNDPVGTASAVARSQIIRKLRAAGAAVFWLVLPAAPSRADVNAQVDAAKRQLRGEAGVTLLDGSEVVSGAMTRDTVHYDREGYVQIAQFVVRKLKLSAWWLWSLAGLIAGGGVAWYFSKYR